MITLKGILKESRKTVVPVYRKLRRNLMPYESKVKESRNPTIAQMYLTLRHIRRGDFWFMTINEAVLMTAEWVRSMSSDFDVVIAVPRSGLLFGEIIVRNSDLFGKSK